jgi:hypothetical protein
LSLQFVESIGVFSCISNSCKSKTCDTFNAKSDIRKTSPNAWMDFEMKKDVLMAVR